jgi:hypothetical protein
MNKWQLPISDPDGRKLPTKKKKKLRNVLFEVLDGGRGDLVYSFDVLHGGLEINTVPYIEIFDKKI